MDSEELEEILNKTNSLLMEKQAKSEQRSFGFFIEGIFLVSSITIKCECLDPSHRFYFLAQILIN